MAKHDFVRWGRYFPVFASEIYDQNVVAEVEDVLYRPPKCPLEMVSHVTIRSLSLGTAAELRYLKTIRGHARYPVWYICFRYPLPICQQLRQNQGSGK